MKMDKSVQLTLIIVLGVVILAAIALNAGKVSSENTIQVQGTASIKASPDLVGIYFNVDTNGTTTAEASSKNAAIVDNLTTALESLGFSSDEIKTQSYNVYPNYDYSNGKTTQKGYKATHVIKLEMPSSSSSLIGNSVDAGVNAGAGINYIDLELSPESQSTYKAQAMKLAAEDATTKAQAVADGFNKKLGKLVSTSINDFNYVPWLAADFSGATSSAEVQQKATNIQPTDQDISASITATFEIK